MIISVAFPHIANQVGWMTAEIGRQPWVVYGLLRTSEGVSPTIHSTQVMISILMFIVIYILLFVLFLFLLDRKIKHGPEDGEEAAIPHVPLYTAGRSFFAFSSASKPRDRAGGGGDCIEFNTIPSPTSSIAGAFTQEENAKNDRPAVYRNPLKTLPGDPP
jgi:hypothetical protein